MLTRESLAYSFSNVSYPTDTSLARLRALNTTRYEADGTTQRVSFPDPTSSRLSGPTLSSADFTESFDTVADPRARTAKASHILLYFPPSIANATKVNDDDGETVRGKNHVTQSSAPQHNRTASVNLELAHKTTGTSLHNTSSVVIESFRYTNKTGNSTTYGVDIRTVNISSTSADPWSHCTRSSYATDFPAVIRSLPPHCDVANFDDLDRDQWYKYVDYVDRCLARWCQTSWISALGAVSMPIPGFQTISETFMSFTWDVVWKTTLTASNELPVYMNYTWGAIITKTWTRMFIT